MKTIVALFVPLFAAVSLCAQETAPAPGSADKPAAASDSAAPAAKSDADLFSEPPSLVPPGSEPAPGSVETLERSSSSEAPTADQQKNSQRKAESEAMKNQVKLRKAKTKALADPKLHELLAQAEAAPQERERRAILRKYYELLYSKMAKIDGSIADQIEARKNSSLKRLDQSNLRDLGQDPRLP